MTQSDSIFQHTTFYLGIHHKQAQTHQQFDRMRETYEVNLTFFGGIKERIRSTSNGIYYIGGKTTLFGGKQLNKSES